MDSPGMPVPTDIADVMFAWVAAGAPPVTVDLFDIKEPEGRLYYLHQLVRVAAGPMSGVDIDAVHRKYGAQAQGD